MINKNKYKIRNTKKLLHKVGKQWVTVSVALLGLIGAGATASTVHADANTSLNTAPKSAIVNSVASGSNNNSASKFTTSSSASKSVSSVASSSALKVPSQATQSNNSASKASISTTSTANSSVTTSKTSSTSNIKNSATSTSTSSARMLGLSAPSPVAETHDLGTTDDNQDLLFQLLNPKTLQSIADNNNGNNAYGNLMNDVGSMANLNFNGGNTTTFSDVCTLLNNINFCVQSLNGSNLSNAKNSLSSLTSMALKAKGMTFLDLSSKPIRCGSNAGSHGTIAHYVYVASLLGTLEGISISPTQSATIVSFVDDMAQIQRNSDARNNYKSAFSAISKLPQENNSQQSNAINQANNYIVNAISDANLPKYDNFTAPLENFVNHTNKIEEIKFFYKGYPHSIGTIQLSGAINESVHISAPQNWLLSNSNNSIFTLGSYNSTSDVNVVPSSIADTIYYKVSDNTLYSKSNMILNSKTVSFDTKNAGHASNSSSIITSSNNSYIPSGYHLMSNTTVGNKSSDGTDTVWIAPNPETENIHYEFNNHQIGSTSTLSGYFDNSSSISNSAPSGWVFSNNASSAFIFGHNGNSLDVNVAPSNIPYNIVYESNNNVFSKNSDEFSSADYMSASNKFGYSDNSFKLSTSSLNYIPSGYHLSNSSEIITYKSDANNYPITVLPNSESVDITYIATNNKSSKASFSTASSGVYNQAINITSGIPSGYLLSNGQDTSYKFTNDQNQTKSLDIIGNSMSSSVTINMVDNADSNNSFLKSEKSTVSGKVGDVFSVSAPTISGYGATTAQSSGVFEFNSLSNSTFTFNYRYNYGTAINVNYINQNNSTVYSSAITGYDGKSGNYTPSNISGYSLNSSSEIPYTISKDSQAINIKVTGNPVKYTVAFKVPNTDTASTQHGSLVGTSLTISGENGDSGKAPIIASNFKLPNNYELDNNSNAYTSHDFNNKTDIVYVDPKPVTDEITFMNSNQNIDTTKLTGLYGNQIPQINLANYVINNNQQLSFNNNKHIVQVLPKNENYTIQYVNNANKGAIIGTESVINEPFNSTYSLSNIPQYWKLANRKNQKILLNNNTINVNVVPNLSASSTNGSTIINTLVELANDSQQDSIKQQSYQSLLNLLSPAKNSPLNQLSKQGLVLVDSNMKDQNYTVLGLASDLLKTINNISNNDSHLSKFNSILNGMTNELNSKIPAFEETKQAINDHYKNVDNVTKIHNDLEYQLAFFGTRFSKSGFVHDIIAGLLDNIVGQNKGQSTEYKIGNAVDLFNAILNNESDSNNYQNILNDLAKYPNQHYYQKSQILLDIAKDIQNINYDGKSKDLQKSADQVINKAQAYTSSTYNDIDNVIFIDNNGNNVSTQQLIGLDGSPITKDIINSKVPSGYSIQSTQLPNMFINDGNSKTHNYVIQVTPKVSTKSVTIYYQNKDTLVGTKSFNITNNKSDNILSNNDINNYVPSGYHINNNNEPVTYDNGIHIINITKNLPSQYTDTINFITKGNHHVGSTTMFGYDGQSYDIKASSLPQGYQLVNNPINIVITSTKEPINVEVTLKQMTNTIKYMYGTNNLRTIYVKGPYGQGLNIDTIKTNVPANYHLSNSIKQLLFDGKTYNIMISPNNVNDIIKFMYDNQQIGKTKVIHGLYNTTKGIQIPSYYSLAKDNSNHVVLDNGTHIINVRPMTITDHITFDTSDGKAISSNQINGAYHSVKNITPLIPNGYKLAKNQSDNILLNAGTNKVLVIAKPKIQPKPNNSSDNKKNKDNINKPIKPNNNGKNKPANNTKGTSNKQPELPININWSALIPTNNQPSNTKSNNQPNNVVVQPTPPSNSNNIPINHIARPIHHYNKPRKHVRYNVINIPAINHHPYVRHGKHMVRVNPKDIKHTRILGIAVNGKHATYYIKVGKVTGYVYGLVKPISKYELINKYAKTYIHFGKRTYRLTYKLLKHAKLIKATLTGKKLVCYVKIGHRIGHVYGRGYVAHYRFREYNHKVKVNIRYYTKVPKRFHYIKTLVPINMYKSFHLTKHARSKHIKVGRKLRIKKLVRNHGVNRFKLTNGYYISANKKFVKFIK